MHEGETIILRILALHYSRAFIRKGETQKVEITVPIELLKYYDDSSGKWVLEKTAYNIFIGRSSDNDDLSKIVVNL